MTWQERILAVLEAVDRPLTVQEITAALGVTDSRRVCEAMLRLVPTRAQRRRDMEHRRYVYLAIGREWPATLLERNRNTRRLGEHGAANCRPLHPRRPKRQRFPDDRESLRDRYQPLTEYEKLKLWRWANRCA